VNKSVSACFDKIAIGVNSLPSLRFRDKSTYYWICTCARRHTPNVVATFVTLDVG